MLHDTVTRKFIDSIETDEWEIETHSGWVDITNINKTVAYDVWCLTLESGEYIECADTHILFTSDGSECFVCDLVEGATILTKGGTGIVSRVEKTAFQQHMYDLTVSGDHTYYANDILHHNTTTCAAFCVWSMLFVKNYTIALVANKASAATEILSRIKDIHENLPVWLQGGVKRWNVKDIQLENGSKVFCAATTANGIRGKSVSLLICDEAAIIPNKIADAFFASTLPVISSGTTTKVVIISTPLGYNHFWKMWMGATNKENEYVPVEVKWFEHPNRDKDWADTMYNLLGAVQYAQEVECSFLGSSHTLFSATSLGAMKYIDPVGQDKDYRVYETPIEGHTYVAVIDPSEGVGEDYSVISVIDITSKPYRQVFMYRSNEVSPTVLPDICYKWATYFNSAYILCEINKYEIVAETLYSELQYPNILPVISHPKKGQIISSVSSGKYRVRRGVFMDKRIKRIGCTNLKAIVENGTLIFNDYETISEASKFIRQRGSFSADEGYNDDIIMSMVIFGWLTTESIFEELVADGGKRIDLFGNQIESAVKSVSSAWSLGGLEHVNTPEAKWVNVPVSGYSTVNDDPKPIYSQWTDVF